MCMCVYVCVLVNDVVYFIVFSISKNLQDSYIIYTIFNIQFLIFHLCSTSNILDTGQSKRKTFSLLFSKFISSAITRGKINNPLPPQYDRMVSRENLKVSHKSQHGERNFAVEVSSSIERVRDSWRVFHKVEAGGGLRSSEQPPFAGSSFALLDFPLSSRSLKSRAEKFSFSHFSCVRPSRCLMNEEACWSKPS